MFELLSQLILRPALLAQPVVEIHRQGDYSTLLGDTTADVWEDPRRRTDGGEEAPDVAGGHAGGSARC